MKSLNCNNHINSFTRAGAIAPDADYIDPISTEAVGFRPGQYTFEYRYPLTTDAYFSHLLTAEMSWIDLLLLAKEDYKEIYRREDEACGPTGNIPGMLNRASSDGPYGIWGHDITDLYFEYVEVDEERRIVKFDIGS